ncbi:MAG: VWA domain-containing protein [Chloroflexi bacterium]|nr:MAG: VWA domain-containing protein [Chloroflexota bacterium]
MSRSRLVFIAIVGVTICIVLGALAFQFIQNISPNTDNTTENGSDNPTPLPADTVLVTLASSSTKANWIDEIVAEFNNSGHTTSSGKTIIVEATPVLSGGSMNDIINGNIQPIAWSPGDDSWVLQLNETWEQQYNKPIASQPCPSTIYTPLGIAMWRPMAEVLGWPNKPIGWQTIVDLAANPDGWGSYGRPEWGKFRFGHANPVYSNAGLLTMTSFVYGMAGKTTELTPADVYTPEIENAMRTLEQNTSKYGTITTALLDLMARQGPGYLHAVATFESDTVRMNLERADELTFPLAFIFPSEGTFWGNHPYCILDNADWVDAEEAEAARIFLDYLLEREQQEKAINHLLRPLDSTIPLHAPLTLENGTIPTANPETVPALPSPDAKLGAAIIDLFKITKRKATVLIVLDVSGSMQGDKIKTAREATVEFLQRLDPDDKVGLIIFSDTVNPLQKPARVGNIVEELSQRVSGLLADGNTALYEAVCEATTIMEQQRKADEANGESRLYGIILLSDGEDTAGTITENQMFATCLPDNAEADGFKIFPIAFGEEADQNLLERIANVTGGRLFTADPDSISRIYRSISAEQ